MEEKMVALLLAKQITVLFIEMLFGVVLVKTNTVKSEESKTLSAICIYLINPCVIIHAFQIDYSHDIRNGLLLSIGTSIMIHCVLLIINALIKRPLKLNIVEQMSIVYSNAGNLIIPLVTAIFGEEWVIYTTGFLTVQLFLLWTHCYSAMKGERQFSIQKILCNVNVIAAIIGVLSFSLQLKLPTLLDDALGAVSSMVGPLSMLMLGMVLASQNLKEIFAGKRVYLIAAFRLVLCPLIIIFLIKAMNLKHFATNGETILLITLLATTTPSATSITQMAVLYGQNEKVASAINTMTTLLCLITMPLMVMAYYF